MARRRVSVSWLGLTPVLLAAASACVVPEFEGDGRTDGAGGGTGGSDGIGGSGTGGTSSGGSASGGSASGGSGAGGTAPSLGEVCTQAATRACDENDAKLPLICEQGTWQSAGSCSTSEGCDPETGLCADIVPSCADLEPADRFCMDDVVMECGTNLVSTEVVEDCEGRCIPSGSSASCVPASCGDGTPDPAEDCDDGNDDNDDDCTELCQAPFCGDGFEQTGETCDDGDDDNGDECTESCEPPVCGDGFVQAGEDCDSGIDNGGQGAGSCPLDCTERVLQVAPGGYHTCALHSSGQVKCWGRNAYGLLGQGDETNRGGVPGQMGDNLPTVDLGTGRSATALVAGDQHTCALLDDGSVKCWGQNDVGQLGIGNPANRGDEPGEMGDDLPAVDLGTGRSAQSLAAGYQHTCALLDDDSVKCWGENGDGQLGLGDMEHRGDEPNEMGDALPTVNLGSGRTPVALTGGAYHTCALFDDDSIKCWGRNDGGQLGLGDNDNRGVGPGQMGDSLPTVDLGPGRTARVVSAGGGHTCALINNYSVTCWGDGSWGRLGHGDMEDLGDEAGEMGDFLPAVELGPFLGADVTLGNLFTCAQFDDASFKCWGINSYGQLGLGDATARGAVQTDMGENLPLVDLGSGRTAKRLEAAYTHNCAVLDDDSVKCWGGNESGQLGLGDQNNRGDEQDEMGDNLPTVDLW